jgi:hypothetical protein
MIGGMLTASAITGNDLLKQFAGLGGACHSKFCQMV